MTRPPDTDKGDHPIEGKRLCLVSGRGSQDVRSIGGLGVFRELASAQGLAFPELLEEAATGDPAKRFREYFKLNTICFIDFCSMERREYGTVEVH
jgi:hypothetical protein